MTFFLSFSLSLSSRFSFIFPFIFLPFSSLFFPSFPSPYSSPRPPPLLPSPLFPRPTLTYSSPFLPLSPLRILSCSCHSFPPSSLSPVFLPFPLAFLPFLPLPSPSSHLLPSSPFPSPSSLSSLSFSSDSLARQQFGGPQGRVAELRQRLALLLLFVEGSEEESRMSALEVVACWGETSQ